MFQKNNNAMRKNLSVVDIEGVEELITFLQSCEITVETLWDSMLVSLKNELLALDRLDYFLQAPEIQRSVHTYQPKLAKKYMEVLLAEGYQVSNYQSISEHEFGKPNRLKNWPNMSSQLVQHNYHLHIMKKFIFREKMPSHVVEFGGGYGAVAKLLLREIRAKSYNIIDLELMCEIQKFYLKNTLEDAHIQKLSWYDSKKEFMLPIDQSCLFLATWSISECPKTVRDTYLKDLGKYGFVCITFQSTWENIDNLNYFTKLSSDMEAHFGNIQIFECSVFKNNFYFLASK
jgi:hypothetical protein